MGYALTLLVAGIAVGTTASWALQRWMEIRARLHYVRRFFAGVELLKEMDVSPKILSFLTLLAENFDNRGFAKSISKMTFTASRSEETHALWDELSPDQESVFAHAMVAYAMASSYQAGKAGRKFRTRVVDRLSDRRKLVAETAQIESIMSECPTPVAA